MTTRDFIKKNYNTTATRERQCSSVFADYKGNIYSYGYHYPLAFHIAGLDFINESGYSSSTAKHIAWARQALDYEYVGVKISRSDAQVLTYYTGTPAEDVARLEIVTQALERELEQIQKVMSTKKRKDTWVYQDLMTQETRVRDALSKVKEVTQ